MSAEENKAIVRRLYDEFWNANNPGVADELIHPDFPHEDAVSGPEYYKAVRPFWLGILPDQHFTVDEIIAEGDIVMARWTSTGTHQGEWPTPIGIIPATGKVTVVPGTSTYHMRDGKIIQDWHHIDFLSMLEQVGAVAQPSESSK